MATRNQIDARVTVSVLAKIEQIQAAHLASHRKCAQLRSDRSETAIASAIEARGVSGAELAAIERIDEYDGPRGQGFIVHLRADESGATYRKSVAFGPEAAIDDWFQEPTLPTESKS